MLWRFFSGEIILLYETIFITWLWKKSKKVRNESIGTNSIWFFFQFSLILKIFKARLATLLQRGGGEEGKGPYFILTWSQEESTRDSSQGPSPSSLLFGRPPKGSTPTNRPPNLELPPPKGSAPKNVLNPLRKLNQTNSWRKMGVASLHSKQSYATTQRKQEMLQSKKGKYFLQLPHLLLSNYRKPFSSPAPKLFFPKLFFSRAHWTENKSLSWEGWKENNLFYQRVFSAKSNTGFGCFALGNKKACPKITKRSLAVFLKKRFKKDLLSQ